MGKKVVGKIVYIILELDKQIKMIGAEPTYETDSHQHNTKIRFLFFSIKNLKKLLKIKLGTIAFVGTFFSLMGNFKHFCSSPLTWILQGGGQGHDGTLEKHSELGLISNNLRTLEE